MKKDPELLEGMNSIMERLSNEANVEKDVGHVKNIVGEETDEDFDNMTIGELKKALELNSAIMDDETDSEKAAILKAISEISSPNGEGLTLEKLKALSNGQ